MPNFDYSVLPESFAKLSKQAKRVLISHADTTALSKLSRNEVPALHGVGPSAMPILETALASGGRVFRLA